MNITTIGSRLGFKLMLALGMVVTVSILLQADERPASELHPSTPFILNHADAAVATFSPHAGWRILQPGEAIGSGAHLRVSQAGDAYFENADLRLRILPGTQMTLPDASNGGGFSLMHGGVELDFLEGGAGSVRFADSDLQVMSEQGRARIARDHQNGNEWIVRALEGTIRVAKADAAPVEIPLGRTARYGQATVALLPEEKAADLIEAQSEVVPNAMGALVLRGTDERKNISMEIRSLKARVTIDGPLALTEIEQTFFNPTNRRAEGTFYFPIPAGASLSRFAMYVDGKLVEGELVERHRAREVYESIVRRMEDPALVEWQEGNLFKTRIFPIPANGPKRIVMHYVQLLPEADGMRNYMMPLVNKSTQASQIGDFDLQVTVRGASKAPASSAYPDANVEESDQQYTVSLRKKDWRPARDFLLRWDPVGEGKPMVSTYRVPMRDGFVMLRFTPKAFEPLADSAPITHRNNIILFDTSLSRAPDMYKAQLAALETLVDQKAKNDTFTIIPFDVKARIPDKRFLSDEGGIRSQIEALRESTPLGASDLTAAFAAIEEVLAERGKDTGADNVILLGDGIATYGETDTARLITHADKVLSARPIRFHAMSIGSKYDRLLLETLANKHHGLFRAINPGDVVEDLAFRFALQLQTRLQPPPTVTVEENAIVDLYPKQIPNLVPGQEVILVGRYKKPGTAKVTITEYGFEPMTLSIDLPDVAQTQPLLPLLWARRRLDDLLLEEGQEKARELIALSQRYGLMTPFTSFLVLENEKAYKRFGIDRKARLRYWLTHSALETQPPAEELRKPKPEPLPIVEKLEKKEKVEEKPEKKEAKVDLAKRPFTFDSFESWWLLYGAADKQITTVALRSMFFEVYYRYASVHNRRAPSSRQSTSELEEMRRSMEEMRRELESVRQQTNAQREEALRVGGAPESIRSRQGRASLKIGGRIRTRYRGSWMLSNDSRERPLRTNDRLLVRSDTFHGASPMGTTAPSKSLPGLEEPPEPEEPVRGDPSEFSELDTDVESPALMGIGSRGGAGGRGGIFGSRSGRGKGRALRRGGGSGTQDPLDLGFGWLRYQQLTNGSWDNRIEPTAWALLSYLGNGNSARFGKYKANVKAAQEWLLKQQDENGMIGASLIDHAMATLALSEASGMDESNADLRQAAQKAIDRLQAMQRVVDGDLYGWGSGDKGDFITSGFAVIALNSAKVAGFELQDKCWPGAKRFFTSEVPENGIVRTRDKIDLLKTAMSMTSRQFLGFPQNDPRIIGGAETLLEALPILERGTADADYVVYFGSLGMFQLGTNSKFWKTWNPAIKKLYLQTQIRDGATAGDLGCWMAGQAYLPGEKPVLSTEALSELRKQLAISPETITVRDASLVAKASSTLQEVAGVDALLAEYPDAPTIYVQLLRLRKAVLLCAKEDTIPQGIEIIQSVYDEADHAPGLLPMLVDAKLLRKDVSGAIALLVAELKRGKGDDWTLTMLEDTIRQEDPKALGAVADTIEALYIDAEHAPRLLPILVDAKLLHKDVPGAIQLLLAEETRGQGDNWTLQALAESILLPESKITDPVTWVTSAPLDPERQNILLLQASRRAASKKDPALQNRFEAVLYRRGVTPLHLVPRYLARRVEHAKTEEARKDLHFAIRAGHHTPETFRLLTTLEEKSENKDEALRAVTCEIELYPVDLTPRKTLAAFFKANGMVDEELAQERATLRIGKASAKQYRQLIERLFELELNEEAGKTIEEMLQTVQVLETGWGGTSLTDLSEAIKKVKDDKQRTRLEQLLGKANERDLQIVMTWNTNGTDIDLHVTEPNGEKCNYQNKKTSADGWLDHDDTNGHGPETYTIRVAQPGRYKVYAHYYGGGSLETEVILRVYRNRHSAEESKEEYTYTLSRGGEDSKLLDIEIP